MQTQFFRRCLFGLVLCTGVYWQGLFGQGTRTPAGGAGGTGSRGPSLPSGQSNNIPTTPNFSQHPLFLSGKVSMEDGTAPPDSTIQLVCHSSPRSIGHTDSKGGFSIDVNNRVAMMNVADAS